MTNIEQMQEEIDDLGAKIEQLKTYEKETSLETEISTLIDRQLYKMQGYRTCLKDRIVLATASQS